MSQSAPGASVAGWIGDKLPSRTQQVLYSILCTTWHGVEPVHLSKVELGLYTRQSSHGNSRFIMILVFMAIFQATRKLPVACSTGFFRSYYYKKHRALMSWRNKTMESYPTLPTGILSYPRPSTMTNAPVCCWPFGSTDDGIAPAKALNGTAWIVSPIASSPWRYRRTVQKQLRAGGL